MEQTCVVVKILPTGQALVETRRPTACGGHCEACGLCAAAGAKMRARADNPLGARAGDRVTVSTGSGRVLGWAALLYLLPVCTLLLGIFLFPPDGLWPCLGALCGLLPGLGLVLWLARRSRRPLPMVITQIEGKTG